VNGKFFTFPLCILAMPLREDMILQHIVSHAMERAGGGNGAEHIDRIKILEYLAKNEKMDYCYCEQHDVLTRGAIITGVTIGSYIATASHCEAVKEFVAEHERKHGSDPLVFIAAELLWSCHNDQDFSFRDFSTTCAVNSMIGFKRTPVLIRRAMIIARQLGYKTPKVMSSELTAKSVKRQPLSVQQLRDTLDNLERRDLFRRCQASPRTVYFSTTLDRTELLAAVKERVEKWSKLQKFRQQEREMFSNPNRNQSGTTEEPLKKETSETGKIGTTKGETSKQPDGGQSETAEGTITGTKCGTTKINAFSKNAFSSNASLTNAFKQEQVNNESVLAHVVEELAGGAARGMTAAVYPEGGEPSLGDVRKFMEELFPGAGKFAEEWLKRMKEQAWKDHKGQPIMNWRRPAASWASTCGSRMRGVRKYSR
jgi:hypothetical protein